MDEMLFLFYFILFEPQHDAAAIRLSFYEHAVLMWMIECWLSGGVGVIAIWMRHWCNHWMLIEPQQWSLPCERAVESDNAGPYGCNVWQLAAVEVCVDNVRGQSSSLVRHEMTPNTRVL